MKKDAIDDDVLELFKNKLHILHDDEDDNLILILEHAYDNLIEKCGYFSLKMAQGLSLVFERARYDYFGKLEYFDVNFQGEVHSLLIRIEKEKRRDD